MDYKVNHIPKSQDKRSGRPLNLQWITIHSTGNPKSTAKNERDWLTNPSNNRVASWHLVVDQKEVIEAIPLNEVAYHAGNSTGNNTSIGIEICESGDRGKTIDNAVKLTAKLLHERNWGIDKLKRHFDWSGKICPRIMHANNWEGWEGFKIQVDRELKGLSSQVKVDFKGNRFSVNGYLQDGSNYVRIRDVFEKAGFIVDWDNVTKTVIIK